MTDGEAQHTTEHDGSWRELQQRIARRIRRIYDIETAYDWQYEACEAILKGRDCVLSVPTGGGKTLAFYLPLFAYWEPGDREPANQKVVLIVSPLVELMKEQVSKCNVVDFGSGKFHVGLVSPEVTKRADFHEKVTARPEIWDKLVLLVFDEAHTILEWGGSFRPDYRDAGGIVIMTSQCVCEPYELRLASHVCVSRAIQGD
ncbi:P-loop containing nucleoside triphosphate hydrolase protein [Gautieria morchelliformis]|nr:P-loop containing nucleoside triphosphate hydrolase protein [Gautieria morchelliformis]